MSQSLWNATLPAEWSVDRPPLTHDRDADVCIVGAGYTGLWTAYHLVLADPSLRVVVLESETVGFGASGRNGGWCSAIFPASLEDVAARSSKRAALALHAALVDSLRQVGEFGEHEGLDTHFRQGGYLHVATSAVQLDRVRDEAEASLSFDPSCGTRLLDAGAANERIRAAGVLGGAWYPHVAAVHPARLAHAAAIAAERRGVVIHERSRAIDVSPRRVRTDGGTVRADVVVLATEGYTPRIRRHRRDVIPLYSMMIATEPLSEGVWDEIGWRERDTFNDGRQFIIYAQRTIDDRIAIGGRGAPYHFGSKVDPSFDTAPAAHEAIHQSLVELFPAVADAAITHRWGGPLAAPRDWMPSVNFSPATGFAQAGGYVGDGVCCAHLAGRTLAALIAGGDHELTTLPWVGHRSRRWEPEPLRWMGITAGIGLAAGVDRREAATGRPARVRYRLSQLLQGR